MALKGLSYDELKNLINYFERNLTFTTHTYEVKAKRLSPVARQVVFEITFPKSYIKALPMESAIKTVLNGHYENS